MNRSAAMAGIGGDGGSDYASVEGRNQYQRRGSSNGKGGGGGGCYGAAEFHASQPIHISNQSLPPSAYPLSSLKSHLPHKWKLYKEAAMF